MASRPKHHESKDREDEDKLMSTFVAVTARETAFIFGSGILHGIAPGAIEGFAVGVLAAGACCLVVAAPRLLHRARRSARDGMCTDLRRSKVQRDYFAAPVDVDPRPAAVSQAVVSQAVVSQAAVSQAVVSQAAVSQAAVSPPAVSAVMVNPVMTSPDVTNVDEPGVTMHADLFAPEAEVLGSPAAMRDLYEVPAQDCPYGPELSVDPFGAVDGSDAVLPGTRGVGAGRDRSGRSAYHCKHSVTGGRPDARSQPRHAAPTARLATRMSGRFAGLPLLARN
jgi:hypothetical protein